ncbi:MAG: L-fucose/L-arabinose isomerase family protein [Planctomycetota bacterium]|jgi:L-fucose isomerase-like protein
MKEIKPLMGLCPIGKFVFSNEDAVKYKKLLQKKLKDWQVEFVDLEGVLEDGLVKDQAHIEKAVEYFRAKNIGCLFVPHCNFGTERAVGMIAKKLAVPTLLWGPRDEAPLADGRRLRDTLCGLFASSKILNKLDVPFTYIENCRIDDEQFREGLFVFLRAANVANALRRGIRVGHIGQRIDFFWTTIVNENELLQRFNVEVEPIDMVEFIRKAKAKAEKNIKDYKEELKILKSNYKIEGFTDEKPMLNVLAVRDQMMDVARELEVDGIAFQTFMSIIDEMGAYTTLADTTVNEEYPVGLESDIHGVIGDVMLRRASFNVQPTFMAEFTVRHPQNDNAALLWHVGAPLSMCHPNEKMWIGHHWILPSPLSGMVHFKMKDGPVTVVRFDGERSEYKLAIGEGKTIDGPKTLNNYAWVEVDKWLNWERRLIEGPYIHHLSMTYGNYADALEEACKYIPGLAPVRLDR